jgi:hypothetical protein
MDVMRIIKLIFVLSLVVFAARPSVSGQTNGSAASAATDVTATYAVGEVKAVDAAGGRLTLQTSAGEVLVLFNERTAFVSLPAGEKTLSKATPCTPSDVKLDDRVMARGKVSDDRKTVTSLQVILMSKAALAQKQEQEQERWRAHGIAGRVTAADAATNSLKVLANTPEGERTLVFNVTDKVLFRRYAPDSVSFGDAKRSSLAEVKVGDQLRALGQLSADGASFAPEEVVTGTFRMIGGTITAVSEGSLTVSNVENGQPLTVVLKSDSFLRRFSPELVSMLLAKAEGKEETAGRAGAPARGDVQEVVVRQPSIAAAELKVGDAVIVSGTVGADPSRVTAIMLASNVEPLLKRAKELQKQTGRKSGGSLLGLSSGALDSLGFR